MTPEKAVRLSIENIIVDGLDDVLPPPLEIKLLRKNTELKDKLTRLSLRKIESFLKSNDLEKLSLIPLSHVLVPKKEAFDFRKIAIIRPEDLAVYQAVTIMLAEPFERERSPIARDRIFSYRFKPVLSHGRLFSSTHNLRSFQAKSSFLSQQKSSNYLVKSDISNFYDRINIHRLESTLLTMEGQKETTVKLINQILLHWAKRDSYGLPTGSNGSRILAEVALYNVDRSLKDAGLKFIRFVDDYRIFTKTATEAHSALALLIELLNREGLFINTRKSSIERLDKSENKKTNGHARDVRAEKIHFHEFRIFAGYGGTIPTKFRVPSKRSQKKYLELDLIETIREIKDYHFIKPEDLRDVLYGIIIQEKYGELLNACELVEMFPQFYPFLVDMLIKNVEYIPKDLKEKIVERFSNKIKNEEFISEFIKASLIDLVGHKEFFDRDVVMRFLRDLRRNAGTYVGRSAFDAAQNLCDRGDALEVREYFDRSNEWERRRIIRLMAKLLPPQEYNAWWRSIRTYVSKDPFAIAMK